MNQELVDKVLADWESAPIDAKLKAMLGFLKKMTLTPDKLTAADARAVRQAGVSASAMVDAIYVSAMFNIIDRMADALDFEVTTPEGFMKDTKMLVTRGYKLPLI